MGKKSKIVAVAFDLGEEVFLKTDPDQLKRIVTGACIRPTAITYELTCGIDCTWHYDFEISLEKDILVDS